MARLGTGTGGRRRLRAPADGGRVHEGNRTAAFHNTSVTYIRRDRQSRPPLRRGRVSGLTVGPGRYPADMSRVGLGTPPPALPAPQVGAAGGRVLDDPRPGADPAPARAHRRPDDGHRRARRRGPARAEPAVRAARHQPARAQRHRRHRDHLRRHGHAGAGVAVDRPHAAGPRRRGPGPGPHPARPHRAAVGAAARAGAADVLQGRLQLPRAERDHRARARPVLARPGRGARRRRPAHPHDPHDLARHPRPVRPAVPRCWGAASPR